MIGLSVKLISCSDTSAPSCSASRNAAAPSSPMPFEPSCIKRMLRDLLPPMNALTSASVPLVPMALLLRRSCDAVSGKQLSAGQHWWWGHAGAYTHTRPRASLFHPSTMERCAGRHLLKSWHRTQAQRRGEQPSTFDPYPTLGQMQLGARIQLRRTQGVVQMR